MGQQQSKDELLYQQVNYGSIESIKALHREGAALEWMDREGKTPLIVACMNQSLFNVARTLIELGANVNAYRRGRHAGTPLHHAAKRGLEQTVKLLLSSGANPLVMNDDCQTPLEVARAKGFSNVVRTIESHMCLFSGWMRELYGPGFLELLAPQLLSRKVWVVVVPCGSPNLRKPFKLELAVYSSPQDAQPRVVISLWKANMEEPKIHQPDSTVIITDNSSKTRIKLAAVQDNNRSQLQALCNACKGIPQVVHTTFPFNTGVPPASATAPSAPEDVELAMAINASLQSAAPDIHPHINTFQGSGADTTVPNNSKMQSDSLPEIGSTSSCGVQDTNASSTLQNIQTESVVGTSFVEPVNENPISGSSPSAPPIYEAVIDDGPIHYPSIDIDPVDLSSATVDSIPTMTDGAKEDTNASSYCVVCLDAPAEGVCVPCGHMAGCMRCLKEIETKKWGCPVCRTKIDQVIRVYAV
ncbi:kinase inhibitor [Lithospermum erythrorhizon]|uniref:Kinase inhibitor n=1 Tax=Lithospermum erythrorhizon TaxID=34254 RepID=A0AAV3RTR9_LITER